MRFLTLFAMFLIIRTIYYSYYYFHTLRLKSIYEKFLKQEISAMDGMKYQNEIKHIFKIAKIDNSKAPVFLPHIGGTFVTETSVFNNMFYLKDEFVRVVYQDFNIALGEFRQQLLNTINPIKWISFVVYLPKNLLNYLGVKDSSVFIKIMQFIYWIACIVYILYRNEVNYFLSDLLSRLFK